MVKIIFYKSSSKYYDTVCLKCEKFNSYKQENSENILELEFSEFKNKMFQIKEVLDIIKHWSKTKYYINNKEVGERNLECLIEIIECERRCSECTLNNDFCYEGAGWSCKHIDSIALRKESYYKLHWYEFGKFKNDEWIVDKKEILNNIKKEIIEKNITQCKYFSIENVQKTIDLLPNKITITEDEECEWEYKFREAPLGMKQTEIIGIQPKRKSYSGIGSFGISLSDIFNKDDEETIEKKEIEKNIPTTSFEDIGGINEIVQQIREVIELPLIAPNIFEHYHIKAHKGILLYGPPGCGKTLIAKAIANEINAHFIPVNRT